MIYRITTEESITRVHTVEANGIEEAMQIAVAEVIEDDCDELELEIDITSIVNTEKKTELIH